MTVVSGQSSQQSNQQTAAPLSKAESCCPTCGQRLTNLPKQAGARQRTGDVIEDVVKLFR
jgi:DNA repair exonuclease SbcCD ATPase subunit